MNPPKKIQWAFFFLMPFLLINAAKALAATDEDMPDVTARVARISFISGDVQIKRAEQTEWERATNNLPIVEGDEIVTDANARLEIQFNSENYLRLSENAYLKITTLREEGIALSLPNGSMSVRVLNFNKDRAFFEIDAPQTTVSVEQAGLYRVDAGSRNDTAVRVTVTDSGQARIYTENSGLTLKNGRTATIQIDGVYAGELATSDAAKYADEFDSWALQRDAIVAKRLQNADYDKYYDRDFYGAEELNEYGEWVFTKKYGYAWRPYRDSVSDYADWSPYRYGQWRWIPAYGWTWVNDEPWGWATYHHGRWVHDSGYWYWSPYPQNRGRRSWWRPALVVISYFGNNVCWYPLPYSYGYYNYNSYYHDRRRYKTTIVNNTTVVVNPTPNPTTVVVGVLSAPDGKVKKNILPADTVPETGVVTVAASDFGRNKGNFRNAPVDLAKKALSESPVETVKPLILPTFKDLNGKVSREILVENPKNIRPLAGIKTGATERVSGVPVGENLRKERIFGNRSPIVNNPRTENNGNTESTSPLRNTGAIKRQTRIESPENGDTPVRPIQRNSDTRINPIRSNGSENTENELQSPNRVQRNRERENTPPVNDPPREQRIERPQPRRERPEPVRPEPPREEKRIEAPKRSEPRREEPVRQQPAPKQEPQEVKPVAPNEIRNRREKDNN